MTKAFELDTLKIRLNGVELQRLDLHQRIQRAPQILQLTLARFMEDGHYNAHVRAMRKLYAARRIAMLNALDTHLHGIVSPMRPKGGLQIPCVLADGWSEAQTIAKAAAAGLQLPGLSRLYTGADKQPGWLLGYSSLTAHEIDTAMQQLASALRA